MYYKINFAAFKKNALQFIGFRYLVDAKKAAF